MSPEEELAMNQESSHDLELGLSPHLLSDFSGLAWVPLGAIGSLSASSGQRQFHQDLQPQFPPQEPLGVLPALGELRLVLPG